MANFLVVADQAQGSLGRANHFGDQLGSFVDGRLGRRQPALHGAVNVRAGGELAKSLVRGKKVLRDLKHRGVDGSGLQGDVGHVARAQRKQGDLISGNLVGDENLPGENFGQGAGRGDAESFCRAAAGGS